jgi:hypothetical protein
MPAIIKKGSKGPDVTYCQTLLCEHGYNTGIDGVFGNDTERNVKSYQLDFLLTPDGIVGSATWNSLLAEEREPISFQAIADLLPKLIPQKYTLHGAQCPSNPPGMSLKNIGDDTTNCCTMTGWLLGWAFAGVAFTSAQWKLWMVSTTDDGNVPIVPNWGPRVTLEWGVGTTAPGEAPCLIQYFTETGGHSLIVVAHDPETDKILTLESNSAGKLDGCGWFEIGNLRDVFNPGPQWMDSVKQTWESRFGSKVAVHVTRLEITGVQEWLEQG